MTRTPRTCSAPDCDAMLATDMVCPFHVAKYQYTQGTHPAQTGKYQLTRGQENDLLVAIFKK